MYIIFKAQEAVARHRFVTQGANRGMFVYVILCKDHNKNVITHAEMLIIFEVQRAFTV